MNFLSVLFLLAIQGESSIKIPLKKNIARSQKGYGLKKNRINQETDMINKIYYFTGNFSIGTPPKVFDLYIDTGSSYLWVEEKDCSECAGFDVQYKPSASSTYKYLGDPIESYYVDGSGYSGYLAKDVVKIGDNIAASSYLVVSTWDKGFEGDNCDGLIGFALKGASDGNPTYMDSLKEAGVIDKKIFGLYLNDLDVGTIMEGIPASNLEIGGYDLETYSTTGKILVTIPITDDSFWQNDFMEIYVDNSKIASTRCVVFDSGTTSVYADTRDYEEIIDYMINNYDYNCELDIYTLYCDCSDVESMPAIYFKYDGVKLKLEPSNMWVKDGNNRCLMDIGDAEEECWLLGDTFMSRYYSIHDMDNMEISFAPAVLASTGSSSAYLSIAFGIWLYF